MSVIATSSGAAAAYVRERLTNLRMAMFLELATTAGALTGAALAGFVSGRWLYVVFSGVMAYSALAMLRKLGPRPCGKRSLSSRVPNASCTACPPAWCTARRHPSAALLRPSAPARTLHSPSEPRDPACQRASLTYQ
ncbi:TSUP family transporter [Vitiosangium sp. GDMCC 1.1324]|uniref:TSUP family transporter n=1 Tax=Vitiosangium sp. (strain GDMCC 1.1324) TaxID=2138576 RepID=UPI003512D26A